jgi:hypothetical protein
MFRFVERSENSAPFCGLLVKNWHLVFCLPLWRMKKCLETRNGDTEEEIESCRSGEDFDPQRSANEDCQSQFILYLTFLISNMKDDEWELNLRKQNLRASSCFFNRIGSLITPTWWTLHYVLCRLLPLRTVSIYGFLKSLS